MPFFFDNGVFVIIFLVILFNALGALRKRGGSSKQMEYGDESYEWEDLLSEEGEKRRTIRDSLYRKGESIEPVPSPLDSAVWHLEEAEWEEPKPVRLSSRSAAKIAKVEAASASGSNRRRGLVYQARQGLVWGIVLGPCKSKEIMMDRRIK